MLSMWPRSQINKLIKSKKFNLLSKNRILKSKYNLIMIMSKVTIMFIYWISNLLIRIFKNKKNDNALRFLHDKYRWILFMKIVIDLLKYRKGKHECLEILFKGLTPHHGNFLWSLSKLTSKCKLTRNMFLWQDVPRKKIVFDFRFP